MFSSGWVLLTSVNHDVRGYLTTAVAVAIVFRTRMNPLWLIAAGAILGIAGVL
jgi:chromate transporter